MGRRTSAPVTAYSMNTTPTPSETSLLRRIPPHLLVAAAAWVSRIIIAGTGLLMLRFLIVSLGTEQYALYAVLSGLQGWFLLADFGLGNSLQNHISEARANELEYRGFIGLAVVGAALILLLSIAALLLLAPVLVPKLLPGFTTIVPAQKTTSFIVIAIIFMATAAGSLVYRIWYAEQRGYLANLVPAVAALISLAGVLYCSAANLENRLIWLVTASFLPTALLPLLCLLWRCRHIKFLAHKASLEQATILLKRAAKFWGFALLAAAVLQVDYLIMSQLLPTDQIVVYNVTTKFFTVAFMFYSALLTALWPVCAEAAARRDWGSIRAFLKRYLVVGSLFVLLLTLLLAVFMPQILALLAPRTGVTVPVQFILLTGLYLLLRVWCDTFALALQSMSYVRPFYLYLPFQALASGLLQWFLAVRFGLNGIMLGLIASFALTAVWVLPWSLRKRMAPLG